MSHKLRLFLLFAFVATFVLYVLRPSIFGLIGFLVSAIAVLMFGVYQFWLSGKTEKKSDSLITADNLRYWCYCSGPDFCSKYKPRKEGEKYPCDYEIVREDTKIICAWTFPASNELTLGNKKSHESVEKVFYQTVQENSGESIIIFGMKYPLVSLPPWAVFAIAELKRQNVSLDRDLKTMIELNKLKGGKDG